MVDQRYLYPRATVRLVPGWEKRSKQTPTTVAAHTAVDSKTAHTLWGHVSLRGTAKYHFFVRKFPDPNGNMVEQYLPTNVRGAGMRKLDGKNILVETDDDGDPEGIPWNQLQLDALIDLFAWCADAHQIPRRLVTPNTHYSLSNWRRWVVGAEGFCFHSQPAREPSGRHRMIRGRMNYWTSSQGKTCPGDTRVAQFYDTVLPALLGGAVSKPPAVLVYGKSTLGLGDKGPAVAQLQSILNDRHQAMLDVDGDYGPATEAAVLVVQQALGVTADGLWGPETAAASYRLGLRVTTRIKELQAEIAEAELELGELRRSLARLVAGESGRVGRRWRRAAEHFDP